MLRAELAELALAAPVALARIANELGSQTELSLLTIVKVKIAGFGYSVLRLLGLRLTLGSAVWQVGAGGDTVSTDVS